jgi:hypothetical protein
MKQLELDFEKGTPNPAQSEKDFEHDYDDGLMFMHSHGLWEALSAIERFYECQIYGVLSLEDIVENLREWSAFDGKYGDEFYLCNIDDVPKKVWLNAMESAYSNINDNEYGYEAYLEYIYDYAVDYIKLHNKIKTGENNAS